MAITKGDRMGCRAMKEDAAHTDFAATLRDVRLAAGATLADVAERMGIDVSQVQRRESGNRRITMQYFMDYCREMNVDFLGVFRKSVDIPIIGTIDENHEIHPPPVEADNLISIPLFFQNVEHLLAVRYQTRNRLERMSGHVALFYSDVTGIPYGVWGKRCVMRRADGSQRIGWLFQEDGQVHVFHPGDDVEFNVKLEWASPVIAIVSPEFYSSGSALDN